MKYILAIALLLTGCGEQERPGPTAHSGNLVAYCNACHGEKWLYKPIMGSYSTLTVTNLDQLTEKEGE